MVIVQMLFYRGDDSDEVNDQRHGNDIPLRWRFATGIMTFWMMLAVIVATDRIIQTKKEGRLDEAIQITHQQAFILAVGFSWRRIYSQSMAIFSSRLQTVDTYGLDKEIFVCIVNLTLVGIMLPAHYFYIVPLMFASKGD